MIDRVCVICGKRFAAHRSTAMYCGDKCRNSQESIARRKASKGAADKRTVRNEQADAPIYPAPVMRYKISHQGGWLYAEKDNDGEFFAKAVAELVEAHDAARKYRLTGEGEKAAKLEIVDAMTVLRSWLYHNYKVKDAELMELFAEVNAKNKARGYLE